MKIYRLLVIPILFLCFSYSFGNEKVISEAETYINRGNYERAIIHLVNYIYENNESRELLAPTLNLAIDKKLERDIQEINVMLENYVGKADIILEEQRQKRERLEALQRQYRNFERQGQFFNARRILEEMQAISPDYEFVERGRKDIISRMSNFIAPGSTDVYMRNYANAYLNFIQGDVRGAIPHLRAYNAFRPNNTETSNQLALLEKYMRFERVNRELLSEFEAGENLFRANNLAGARQRYAKVLEIYDRNKGDEEFDSYNLARYNTSRQRLEEIRVRIARQRQRRETTETTSGHEVNPQRSDELYNEGIAAYTQGRIREAIMRFEAALRYNPDNSRARNALDRARRELRD
jgi:tetratricopeptide (TPR) repeat protein